MSFRGLLFLLFLIKCLSKSLKFPPFGPGGTCEGSGGVSMNDGPVETFNTYLVHARFGFVTKLQ